MRFDAAVGEPRGGAGPSAGIIDPDERSGHSTNG
jgi:hypothetical protein